MKCILDILKNWCNPLWVKQALSLNNIYIRYSVAYPTFTITGTGTVTISGGGVEQIYVNPNNQSVNFPIAAHEDITINGDVTRLASTANTMEYINTSGNALLISLYLRQLNLSALTLAHDTLQILTIFNSTLQTIDVSGCPNLQNLNVSSNGNLASLNVSGAVGLQNLEVNNTALTTLDLSAQTQLAYLRTNGCASLATLTLNSAVLTDVECSGIAATTLDFSNCPGLQSLYFEDTLNLTTLDLSTCTVLDYMECYNAPEIVDLKYRAMFQNGSVNYYAGQLILNANSSTGTLHLHTGDPYTAQIEAAATTKGWTTIYDL